MPTEVSSGVLGSTPVSLHNNKGIEDVMISLSLLRHRRSEVKPDLFTASSV